MAQRISRAKASIAGASAIVAAPDPAELSERMHSVRHVLYLTSTAGHTTASGVGPPPWRSRDGSRRRDRGRGLSPRRPGRGRTPARRTARERRPAQPGRRQQPRPPAVEHGGHPERGADGRGHGEEVGGRADQQRPLPNGQVSGLPEEQEHHHVQQRERSHRGHREPEQLQPGGVTLTQVDDPERDRDRDREPERLRVAGHRGTQPAQETAGRARPVLRITHRRRRTSRG